MRLPFFSGVDTSNGCTTAQSARLWLGAVGILREEEVNGISPTPFNLKWVSWFQFKYYRAKHVRHWIATYRLCEIIARYKTHQAAPAFIQGKSFGNQEKGTASGAACASNHESTRNGIQFSFSVPTIQYRHRFSSRIRFKAALQTATGWSSPCADR